MIRFSVAIQRGCFGGCTFCSITEHEGRIIQSRSEDSVIREIETIRDEVAGFTGVISDLGGPTANMYRLHCKSTAIESACRRPSCVFPGICPNLNTDHAPLIELYRRARALQGVKKVLIASGVRYDLAIESPEYVKELGDSSYRRLLENRARGHRRGPAVQNDEARRRRVLPVQGAVRQVLEGGGQGTVSDSLFHRRSPRHSRCGHARAGVVAEEERLSRRSSAGVLALADGDRHRDVSLQQESLRRITRSSEEVVIPKGIKVRRLHKAFLRYHDPENWPLLREALKRMGRADLIGNGKQHLIPAYQPVGVRAATSARPFRTQHTGLPKSGRARRQVPAR